jgi:hypothetical protein
MWGGGDRRPISHPLFMLQAPNCEPIFQKSGDTGPLIITMVGLLAAAAAVGAWYKRMQECKGGVVAR